MFTLNSHLLQEAKARSLQVEMAGKADIVFAPYNYLIDPLIVSQRKLDLNNDVSTF